MDLIFQTMPAVTFATNIFENVRVILQFVDTKLIELVQEEGLGFTSEISIYHSDGTYLAKAKGNRLYPTDDGKKAGLVIDKKSNVWECKQAGRTIFEIHQQQGDAFKAIAELYTSTGQFLKFTDSPIFSIDDYNGGGLQIPGVGTFTANHFHNCQIGIWIQSIDQGTARFQLCVK